MEEAPSASVILTAFRTEHCMAVSGSSKPASRFIKSGTQQQVCRQAAWVGQPAASALAAHLRLKHRHQTCPRPECSTTQSFNRTMLLWSGAYQSQVLRCRLTLTASGMERCMAETTLSMSSEAAGSGRDRADRSLVSWRPCSSPYLQRGTVDT